MPAAFIRLLDRTDPGVYDRIDLYWIDFACVVELRYFGGLSLEEAAEVLQISPETITRDWRTAKTWLFRELSA